MKIDNNTLCIIQTVSKKKFVLYSYNSGHYYLLDNQYFPVGFENVSFGRRKTIHINEKQIKLMADNALNPNDIDIEVVNSPIVVGLMIANYCNLQCKYCISNNGNGYSINNIILKNSERLIEQLCNSGIIAIHISGGEPCLNIGLPSFLRKISEFKFLSMLDTNGTILTEELLEALKSNHIIPRISLDSYIKEIHNKNRGKFNETINNIGLMLEREIPLRISTVFHKDNADTIYGLADWIKSKRIKKWHIYKLQKAFAPESLWMNSNMERSILEHLIECYKEDITILCKLLVNDGGYSSFMIDSEGNCFTTEEKKGKIIFGNLLEQDISDIWNRTPLTYRINHYMKYMHYNGIN